MPGAKPVPARIGPITISGLTIATARLAGRTTASTGAIEEISVSGATLSGGVLTINAAAAGTLTGTTLSANVVTSSLTTVGTLIGGATGAGFTIAFGSSTMTGTVPVANGGTAIASYTIGDLLYASGATTLAKLADAATGNVLLAGGAGVAPGYGKVTTAHTTGIAASGANADITALSALATISTVTENGLGGTLPAIGSTAGVGYLFDNTTAAANNAQQVAPTLRISSNGWASGASSSMDTTWQIGSLPVQGSSSPSANFTIQFSVNANAFTTPFSFTSAGALTMLAGLTATTGAFSSTLSSGAITAPSVTSTAGLALTATSGGAITLTPGGSNTAGVVIKGGSTGNSIGFYISNNTASSAHWQVSGFKDASNNLLSIDEWSTADAFVANRIIIVAGGSVQIPGTGGIVIGGGTNVKNIRHGISGAMTAGSVTVTDTGATANTRYFFSPHTLGTVTVPTTVYASSRSAGASFVLTSANALDTSTYDWVAVEP